MTLMARLLMPAALAIAGAITVPLAGANAGAAPMAATVSVDFGASRGVRFEAERFNNVSRPTTFTAARDADIDFFIENGLRGHIVVSEEG